EQDRNRVAVGVCDGEVWNAVAVEITGGETERAGANRDFEGTYQTRAPLVEHDGHAVAVEVRVRHIQPAVPVEVSGDNGTRAEGRGVVVSRKRQDLRR